MKKALAGPAKPAAKKQPERRAMIAAARRQIAAASARASQWARALDRRADRLLQRAEPAVARGRAHTRPVALRWQRRVRPLAVRWTARARAAAVRRWRWAGRLARPAAALFFRALATTERHLRAAGAAAARGATRASAAITPSRAICVVVVASAICLVVAQFVDYRSVEIGRPGYAGLPAVATPPTIDAQTSGQAHSYLLVPVALLAAVLAVLALRPGRRRGLGRAIVFLGLLCVALILLVDLPAGLDAGVQSSRFAGATAVLRDGFYAELAAAAGLVLGGLLYYARPCRTRTNSYARVASALRRRRRRRASSPARAARSASQPPNGAASAPASPR
jgi:hypothetical protein